MAGSASNVNPHSQPPQFEAFTIHEYETTNNFSLPSVRETKALVLNADPFPPYPSYNACAPISRNITVGDDPDKLPFIPFADDPDYDYDLDIEHHSYFAWPNLTQDPDSNHLNTLEVLMLIPIL
jgi:histone-lysine N-methyltransferase EZH2